MEKVQSMILFSNLAASKVVIATEHDSSAAFVTTIS
jgi:hypothetical protein